ncbi:Nif3-like dinuclear metal center hexameric protein [Helicobacter marmotae]|uniref:GTP cyclohydrolase 1 type 2 homolog n=1 Tax=Helicobacter marmotae TaxID=152490 RepID=A0A3D8I423_9HELI|nr:Nif3-like dinuclear metal center hexameric protein [Helicobacter marmotae]RDU59504.1 Nif3-like dinuclear metal center hexameric protein [Helicobacter marmotae]
MAYKVRDIYELCDSLSPFDSQESWDKSGLNLGSLNDECSDIVVCLELSKEIALSLKPHTLVITHHPLFFRALSAFHTDTYPANLASILIAKQCSLLSLHTNFDKSHLNAYLTHNVLKWRHFLPQGLCMYGRIEAMPLMELGHYVCSALGARSVNVVQASVDHLIEEVYVVCGSGCSLLDSLPLLERTCFITGDIKHHDAMSAKSMGISLIDMGHYESEKYFVEIFQSILQNAGYKVIIKDCKNPFSLCLQSS